MVEHLPTVGSDEVPLPIAAMPLETILAELRRLAVAALDGGHPVVAARIAAAADQVEADSWPVRLRYTPPRPASSCNG
jgi:hypothetical protein